MDEEKRGRRRRDKERMKARARRIYGRMDSDFLYSRPPHEIPDQARHEKLADHIKACSCTMCCNPRRSPWSKKEKLTLQERKFLSEDGE